MAENSIPAQTTDHGVLLRQALRAVEQMQRKLDVAEQRVHELAHQPIAIVGMGCRFPGAADDAASFWELLREGREAISEVPADRWNIDEYYDPDPAKPGKMVSRFGGFLTDIDKFDAAFFGIAPREAAMIDPQQRLLLEVTWQALESGAIAPRSLAGSSTGIYLGIASGDYGQMQLHAGDARLLDVHYASGNGHSIASGRLSYLLGLKGPSVSIDTACSSSLVAVHLASQALRTGECSMAIAGGVNVILTPETTVALSHAHMLAPDGRSKAFDARADGFGRAEGCGLVVLKPLVQAVADGDHVFAVIRGTAVNQDGASSSLTAPNGPAQEELMRRALADAGVAAGEIGYVESHGTGTALGDPIELRALGGVYGAARKDDDPLLVGSLKTNLGHMESAAGVGGLIKLVLSLEHGAIPAHVGFETPTPHVPWDRLRLAVARTTKAWPAQEKPRLGAVSSFGFSGTNAHLIVEQGPVVDVVVEGEEMPQLLPLSAKSSAALHELTSRYADWLESDGAGTWDDVAATAAVGRDHFRHRAAVVASSRDEAAAALRALIAQGEVGSASQAQAIGFLFTGQGSERTGMGLELLERSGVFRAAVERLEAALGDELGTSIASIWANAHGELERASLVQPALYAYGWALSEVWRSWGVEPRVVLGHSLGEYVAATVAGVMTPEEGIRLVAARGRLTETLGEPGGMVAVAASEEAVRGLLIGLGELSVAAVNGHSSVVVSGALGGVERFEERLKTEGLRHKRLRTTHGFHSEALDGMLDALAVEAAKVQFKVPEIRWISNLTGHAVERNKPVDAEYWRRHLRETVLFGAGLAAAEAAGATVFVEVGAEPQLLALAGAHGVSSERLVASMRKGGREDEWQKLLMSAGRIYGLGVDLDWKGVGEHKPFRKVVLPGYPFERRRFWFTDAVRAVGTQRKKEDGHSGHPLLGVRVRSRSEAVTFHGELTAEWPAHLGDHVVSGRRILPGAAYLEIALAVGRAVDSNHSWSAVEVEFREPCVFDEARLLETVVYPLDAGRRSFEIASAARDAADGGWTLHVTGFIEAATDAVESAHEDLGSLQDRAARVWSGEEFYRRLRRAGLEFGPAFCPVTRAWGGASESLVALELMPAVVDESGLYGLHPVALDACLQAAAALMDAEDPTAPALPAGVERFRVWGDPAALRFARASVRKRQRRGLTVDVYGLDGEGRRILEVVGLTLVEASALRVREEFAGWLHEVVWEKLALSAVSSGLIDHASLEAEVARQAERNDVRGFDRWMHEFDELCAAWIMEGFERGGFALTAGRSFDPEELIRTIGVAAEHWRLMRRFVEILVEFGYVETVAEGRYRSLGRSVEQGRLSAAGLAAAGHAEMAWTERMAVQLLPLLRGELNAVDALFAEGGQEIATRLYRESVVARTLNPLLALMTLEAVAAGQGNARVLEVGGGTAATTSYLVPALRGKIGEYIWTDIGAGFVSAARREFAGVEGMRFQMLDLEQEPATQGLAGELFDVLVASNVIHATTDIRHALRHVRSLLKPGGVLLLAETVGRQPWVDLTVGFTDGWWRFKDRDLRPEYALIGREVWIQVLRESGFGDVALLPAEDVGAGVLGKQCLISAVAVEVKSEMPRVVIVSSGESKLAHLLAEQARRDGAAVQVQAADAASRWAGELDDATEVFYLPGAEIAAVHEDASGASAMEWQERVLGGALILTQALLGADKLTHCRLWLVSRGGCGPEIDAPEGASLAAFARSVRAETRDALVTAVDLCSGADEAEKLWRLCKTVVSPTAQYALREDAVWVPRLAALGLSKEPAARFAGFKADGAYVVTGGFNGLGLLTVEWLAGQGAGCVLALGRSEPDAEALALFERSREQGTKVVAVRCDVSDASALADALRAVPDGFRLRGVFHAAGVLDNGVLANQSVERFRAVLKAKVAGAWNLHRLTLSTKLDCFVLFASAAGVLGARGQANHAAANAYMDALAGFRRQRLGLTALSVDWGVWSGAGAAVRHGAVERSERLGAAAIAPVDGLRLLCRLLEEDCTQVIASPVDWWRWAESAKAEAAANADLLTNVLTAPRGDRGFAEAKAVAPKAGSGGWLAQLIASHNGRQRPMLEARVEEQVRSVLAMPANQAIDRTRPLQEYGLDSLLSIELRNALSADLETKLSATALFDYPTMGGLTDWLFDDVLKLAAETTVHQVSKQTATEERTASQSGYKSGQDVLSEVAELSDDEVERLFQLKMAGTHE
jgi:acyl transferase domain-containing protein/NAD(P)-dependent dehydrogenase (short-subunit alcohol dehydrogenase family)/acyl carrier protein